MSCYDGLRNLYVVLYTVLSFYLQDYCAGGILDALLFHEGLGLSRHTYCHHTTPRLASHTTHAVS